VGDGNTNVSLLGAVGVPSLNDIGGQLAKPFVMLLIGGVGTALIVVGVMRATGVDQKVAAVGAGKALAAAA
jgi:hypothetical protein